MQKEDIETKVDEIMKRLSLSARGRFKKRYMEAKEELKKFEATMKKNLRKYTLALSDGELTQAQYKQLVADDIRLAEMKGLTQAGITAVEMQKFKTAALSKILEMTLDTILPETETKE